MTFTEGMRSSATDNWATPIHVFQELDKEFHFTLDVCAGPDNHKCDRYFDEQMDGLKQDWTNDICWMNPPYGRVIGKWIKKASDTAKQGGVVVALIPARTDTKWWREYVMTASELRFISGRLKFGSSDSGAPFPSVIAVFGTPTSPRVKQVSFGVDE